MSADFEDCLPSDVARLLESERSFTEMPVGARARVARRLAIPLVTQGIAHATWKAIAAKSAVVIVAVGGGLAGLHYASTRNTTSVAPTTLSRAIPVVVAEAEPRSSSGPAPVATPVDEPIDESAKPSVTASAVARPAATAIVVKVDDPVRVAAEHRVLDEARAAVVRGEPEKALVATAEHAQRFPRGTLTEERYAIEIRALAHLNRKNEARAALEELTTRYPHSFLLEGATQDVESIP